MYSRRFFFPLERHKASSEFQYRLLRDKNNNVFEENEEIIEPLSTERKLIDTKI